MADDAAKIKWGVERRLEFIEFRLFWEGGLNRSDIVTTFQVSEPQASKDLSLYQERAPGNAIYDKNSKRYVPSENFAPVFLSQQPTEYLQRLRSLAERLMGQTESWLGSVPEIDVVLTPEREVGTDILRDVLKANRERLSIDIFYQSMSRERPDPVWRRVTPHAFGYDGFRWHMRGYCHMTDKFKDFLLPRILGVRGFFEPGLAAGADDLWQEFFEIEIAPHPDLAPSQRAIVAKDYGMTDGSRFLCVRYAMLFYVLKRLGLLDDPEKRPARSQHIVVVNRAETQAALVKAEFSL